MTKRGGSIDVADQRAASCAAYPAGGPGERAPRHRASGRPGPPAHPHRPGRYRKDAAGAGRRAIGPRVLPGRGVLGGAGPDRGPGIVAPAVAAKLGVPDTPGQDATEAVAETSATIRCWSCWTTASTSPERGRPDRVPAGRLPGPDRPGHQPRGPRRRGRAHWQVPPLSLPKAGTAVTAAALAASDAVKLFEQRAQLVRPSFRVTDENAAEVACHLPAARRPAAGHRAGRGADADPVLGSARRAAGRHLRRAGRRRALRAAPPSGAARDPGLEPRHARRRGAGGLPAAGHLRRRLHAGRGRTGRRRRRHQAGLDAGAADQAGGQVAAAGGAHPRRLALPPAGDDPRVRAGPAGRGGRARPGAAGPPGLLHRARGDGRRPDRAGRGGGTASSSSSTGWTPSCPTCGGVSNSPPRAATRSRRCGSPASWTGTPTCAAATTRSGSGWTRR